VSYMYAVARLRAMENRFLDASFFSRLIESATLEDALKSLNETVYAQWIAASSEAGFDKLIDSELIAACEDLARFVPDKELLDIYRMPYDFNNVKVILKSLFKVREGGERRYDLLSKMGSVDTESLIMAIEGEEYGFFALQTRRNHPPLPVCVGSVKEPSACRYNFGRAYVRINAHHGEGIGR